MNKTELINFLLLNSKKNLNDISSEIGVNRSNLYLWQKGKTKPTNANINNLADFLGVDLEWLDKDNVEVKNFTDDRKIINLKTNVDALLVKTQKETIKLQREKISQLEKEVKKYKYSNKAKNKSHSNACTFNLYTSLQFKEKIDKNNITDNFIQSSERIIEGNTSSLGYSNRELSTMSAKDFMLLYHPDSIQDGLKTMELLSENSNSIISLSGVRLLKSKNGDWVTFNCKMYWERHNIDQFTWWLNAFYTELKLINTN